MKSTNQLTEFREMPEVEFRTRYQELMKELFNLRFQTAVAQLSSPARFKQVRKEIARLKSIANERNLTL